MEARTLARIVHGLGSLKRSSTRGARRRNSFSKLARVGAMFALAALVMQNLYTAAPSTESIATFASNCSTPQSIFFLGDTVCAVATGSPLGPPAQRRIEWVSPDGSVFQLGPFLTSDPQSDSITIPADAPVGTWQVKTVDRSNSGYASAKFVVQDPAAANVDLWCPITAPFQVSPGSSAPFTVFVTNKGPNDAADVTLTVTVATNSTFQSETQVSGPTFTCAAPEGGFSSCTIDTLPAGSSAQLTFVFQVDPDAQAGATVQSTAHVISSTPELFDTDNTFTAAVTISPESCDVTCPGNITDIKDASQCGKVVNFPTPSGSGSGCGTISCTPPSGSVFPIGTTNVVCSGDNGGPCVFQVTIHDTGATISCPANVNVSESSPGIGSAVVIYPAPTFPDSCAVPAAACNPPSGSSFPVGTTTVLCETTNDSASLSCSFTVTVSSLVCVLNCADDIVTNESSAGSGSATVTYANPTTSGCSSVTVTCNPPSGSSFLVGTTTVNCIAKDASQNTVGSCSLRVTVNSLLACMITCPANITQSANSTCEGDPCATVSYSLPATTGNCLSTICSPTSGSSFPLGTTVVNCTATNPSGTASFCSFTVTVTGGSSCTITCPANITESSAGCGNVVSYPGPVTSGSCGDGVPPWSCSPPSGSFFPVGTTTVVCSTDVGTQCSFTVTINGSDAIAPVITNCSAATFALAESCQAVVPNVTSDVEVTDNCTPIDLLTITQSPAAGTLAGIGTNTITLTVKDANNNSATCTTTFTVFEVTPPTASCKNITVFLGAAGTVSVTGADVDNGSTDNCAIATRTVSPNTFSCANKGPNQVTLTVTDTSGNTATCQSTVTVVDNTPPTISCPANVTRNNDPDLCSAVVTYANATATDNCTGVGTPSCTPPSGSIFPKGTTTVTCAVSDASGNSSTCSFSVTVNDTQPPAISCPGNITLEPTCPSGAIATYTAPVGTDNCPGATTARTAGPASGSVFPIGNTTVTYTVTDAGGLTASCSFTVTVKTVAAVIQDLLNAVLTLKNQGRLSGQQAQGLTSKLQAALDAVNSGQTNVACNKLSDFIQQVQGFINNGTLTSAEGQPLINSAAHLRNTLGCTNLGCS